jgi:hypothetical protein
MNTYFIGKLTQTSSYLGITGDSVGIKNMI